MMQPDMLTFSGPPPEIQAMAQEIEREYRKDPNYAEIVIRWLADVGIASRGDPAEDALLFAIVTDRLARGVDRATQNIVRRRDPRPERFQDFFFGYDTVASSDQVEQ